MMTSNTKLIDNKKLLNADGYALYERTEADQLLVRKAINKIRVIFGSQSKFADAIGVFPQQIQRWFSSEEIPLKWVYLIEQLTDGAVKCHELAPGYFPVREVARYDES